MSEPERDLRSFLSELKRRKVFQVAGVYAVVAFVLWQVADLAFEPLGLPPWAMTLVIALTLLGFPLALVLAWAFEVTPEGVRRAEAAVDALGDKGTGPGETAAQGTFSWTEPRALLTAGVAVLLVAGGFLAWRAFSESPQSETGAALQPDAGGVDTTLATSELPIAPGTERSVAVLPFDHLGPDTAADYFTQGVHDAVITALASVGELSVTSRTSVMPYARSEQSIREIASELDVTHVVEGTVQPAGGEVRVTVQLVDGQTDRHLWADVFDRELTTDALFEIQSEIAREVAGALEARLTRAERLQIERRPTGNLAAYDLYLQAQERRRRPVEVTPERAYEVIDLLRRAVALDPEFALAHARLAQAYEGFWDNYWEERGEDQWRDSIRVAA